MLVLRVKLHAVKRSREVKPAPQAERAAQEAQRAIARAEHRGAKALALIEKRRAPVVSGYTSAQAWAEANGYGDQQARRLLALGRALAAASRLRKAGFSRVLHLEGDMSAWRASRFPCVGC